MITIEVFFFGLAGGIIPEVFAVYNLRHTWSVDKPTWVSSPFYWVVTILMILLSGGTAAVYAFIGIKLNALMAIHLGIATPVLIQTAIKNKPNID